MYLFSPKSSKNDSRKSLKRFWTAYDMLCNLVYLIFRSILWEVTATKLFMKYQLVLLVFYSVISAYILAVLPLRKINFYSTTFDWLRINNVASDWLTELHRANFSNSLQQKITKLEPMNLP